MTTETLLIDLIKQLYHVEDSIKVQHDLNEIMFYFATLPPEGKKPTTDEIRSLRQTIVFLDKLREIITTAETPN